MSHLRFFFSLMFMFASQFRMRHFSSREEIYIKLIQSQLVVKCLTIVFIEILHIKLKSQVEPMGEHFLALVGSITMLVYF